MSTPNVSGNFRTPAAVVFDMDGLLLDSERLARDTFIAACHEYGYQPDIAVYRRVVGSTYGATQVILREGYGPDFPFEPIYARWSERYDAHVHHLPVDKKAGVLEILETLTDAGVPLALATSTHRTNAQVKLKLADIGQRFTHLVCGGETQRGKPHPDPYLRACELLGESPARCWALEDSMNGTRAALAAGLTVFQIPDLVFPEEHERNLGQHLVHSLHDIRTLFLELKTRRNQP